MILLDKDRRIMHHRLPETKRLAIADTAAGVWLDPDTMKPIRVGTPERDAEIPKKLKGGRQWPDDGGLYLLSAGLVPGVRVDDGCTLMDEKPEQTAAIDAVEAEYWGKVDDYQRQTAARQTLIDGGVTPGDEPMKPDAKPVKYVSESTGNVVNTKPKATAAKASK